MLYLKHHVEEQRSALKQPGFLSFPHIKTREYNASPCLDVFCCCCCMTDWPNVSRGRTHRSTQIISVKQHAANNGIEQAMLQEK